MLILYSVMEYVSDVIMYVCVCVMLFMYAAENTLCVGDHIPWHSPLDGSDSRLQHMLMVEDPQLQPINTPCGSMQFVQVCVT